MFTQQELNELVLEEVSKDNPSKETIIELLTKGADINARVDIYTNALDGAFSHLCKLFYKNCDGWSEEAVKTLDTSIIQLLIDKGADINSGISYSANGYLQIAALGICSSDLVEVFLKAGADPNAKFGGNRGEPESYKNFMLDYVLDIYKKNKHINDFFDKEVKKIIKLLRQYGAESINDANVKKRYKLNNLLLKEVRKDNPSKKTVIELLAKGADINAINRVGYNVIMEAIYHLSSMPYKNSGKLSLNAVKKLDFSIIQLLIDKGADVNHNWRNCYCLEEAALKIFRSDLVEMLLKAGANPNVICGGDWYKPGPFYYCMLDYLLDIYEKYKSENDFISSEMGKNIELFRKYGAVSDYNREFNFF